MVCAYEIFVASGQFIPSQEKAEEADSALRERMFTLWRKMMTESGFTHDQKLDHMMMGLRRIFSRGKLTVPDVKILMGLAKQSLWLSSELKKYKDRNNDK